MHAFALIRTHSHDNLNVSVINFCKIFHKPFLLLVFIKNGYDALETSRLMEAVGSNFLRKLKTNKLFDLKFLFKLDLFSQKVCAKCAC